MTRTTDQDRSREGAHPPEDLVQACCDGARSTGEIASVKSHCERCDVCRSVWDEYAALGRALDAHELPPMPSVWPAVRAEIKPRPSPLARWAYSFGAAAAVAAGLFVGFLIVPAQEGSSGDWEQSTWAEMGSLFSDESSFGSLDEAFWTMAVPDEEPALSEGGQSR